MLEKKTTKIADRGLKFNINSLRQEAKTWRFFAFSSVVVTLASISLNFLFYNNTKFFILDSREAPVELQQVTKLPFTKARVATFTDEAITKIYGLNFRFIEEQLDSAKKYIQTDSYNKIMAEMVRSNYITLIKEKKAIIALSPTASIYKFEILSDDDVIIWRSYVREEFIGKNISREEITYQIKIKRVVPDDIHPWGLYIESIKEEEVKTF